MFNMSKNSKTFLEKYYPEFFLHDDLDDALMDLDAFITREGLDANDDMTDFGHKAQAVYDEIYMCNE